MPAHRNIQITTTMTTTSTTTASTTTATAAAAAATTSAFSSTSSHSQQQQRPPSVRTFATRQDHLLQEKVDRFLKISRLSLVYIRFQSDGLGTTLNDGARVIVAGGQQQQAAATGDPVRIKFSPYSKIFMHRIIHTVCLHLSPDRRRQPGQGRRRRHLSHPPLVLEREHVAPHGTVSGGHCQAAAEDDTPTLQVRKRGDHYANGFVYHFVTLHVPGSSSSSRGSRRAVPPTTTFTTGNTRPIWNTSRRCRTRDCR